MRVGTLLVRLAAGTILVLRPSICSAQNKKCRLWLAPSYTSTEKRTRYGIFAGVPYRENENLPMAEIAVPLIDMIGPYNRETPQKNRIMNFLESHLWTSQYAGTTWEGNHSVPVLVPGIGVLPQYHSGIFNVDFLQEAVLLRDRPPTPRPGEPHPIRGAITPFYNVTIKATRAIPAGMELFADFGDVWDGNYTSNEFQDTISRHDYDIADKIIRQLVDLYRDFPHVSIDIQEDILDFFLGEVLGTAANKHAKNIRSLIPENPRRLQRVLEAGGSFMYRYGDMLRTEDWFANNGYCLDALRIGRSSIQDAGRGAFANRPFHEGEIVTLSPMLHIADKSLLNMYRIDAFVDPRNGERFHDFVTEEGPIGKQLLLNYCFGHSESSLLLFPLGSHVGLINHRKEPNAYITWSRVRDNGLPNQHAFQDVSVSELAKIDRIVAVMKVVALREIAEDEEVTIDYGDEWQNAYDSYHQTWESFHAGSVHPLRAEDLREMHQHKPFDTLDTLSSESHPETVITACFLGTRERPDGLPRLDGDIEVTEFNQPESGPLFTSRRLFPVDILDRRETKDVFFYNYTVLAHLHSGGHHKVLNVPHAACTFVDMPYTSDIHLAGAFRHSIGIPDRDFPQAWRDLRG